MNDPFVEEIRMIRMEHTRAMGSDFSRIAADIRRIEKEHGDRVICLPPKKLPPLEPAFRAASLKNKLFLHRSEG